MMCVEPESLDEEYLQQPMVCIYPECKFEGTFREVIQHQVEKHVSNVPEYQHPEDAFEEYDRITDEQLGEDQ